MIIGIILAAGEGSRIKVPDRNKTALEMHGKPLVQYGVDLLASIVDKTVLVVGAKAESVKQSVKGKNLSFVEQTQRLGTGHAVQVAMKLIETMQPEPQEVFVGYGDHMMFYTPKVLQDMLQQHRKNKAVITLVAAEYDKPDELAWGRVLRDADGYVTEVVEQKDATPEQRKVTELNAGLYCFDYAFLKQTINELQVSPVSGEYYLTDLIGLAHQHNRKVVAATVPFEFVGIGINTPQQFEEATALLGQRLASA